MIAIDIETYSPADLSKTGVYRYALDPDFKILLFGYSVDGSPVKVVDLALREQIPPEIVEALLDDKVIKSSFNAMFERVCLTRFLWDAGRLEQGTFLPPCGWHCDMVWAGYLGLPMSLKGAGAVLGLEEQKMDEGKKLIKLFCAPVKGSRVMPEDRPVDWVIFKEYNKRDVEVETAIAKKLKNHPVPDSVWEEYWLDQEINDRGILIDVDMVNKAIQLDAMSQLAISNRIKDLTGIDNPRSVVQMKQWLSDNGIELESLGRGELAKIINDIPEPQRGILVLWQQLAMSAVKKYTAMKAAVCPDGRLRGMFKFYGANRTGRFCLAEGTKIFVKSKDNLSEKPIEEVTTDDSVFDGENWVAHDGVVYSGDKEVITWDGITATPEHIVYLDKDTKITLAEAKERGLKLWEMGALSDQPS